MTLNAYVHGEMFRYQIIYALGRGGLVPTRLLSGRLGIKRIGLIPDRGSFDLREDYAIICDDIYDTGKTYHRVTRKMRTENKIFAYLFIRGDKVNSVPDNVIYGRTIEEDWYVVFPWENGKDD
jgi:hypoxanthine phosphoribosyltransferase